MDYRSLYGMHYIWSSTKELANRSRHEIIDMDIRGSASKLTKRFRNPNQGEPKTRVLILGGRVVLTRKIYAPGKSLIAIDFQYFREAFEKNTAVRN